MKGCYDWEAALEGRNYKEVNRYIINDKIPREEYTKIFEYMKTVRPRLENPKRLFTYLWNRFWYYSLYREVESRIPKRVDWKGLIDKGRYGVVESYIHNDMIHRIPEKEYPEILRYLLEKKPKLRLKNIIAHLFWHKPNYHSLYNTISVRLPDRIREVIEYENRNKKSKR